MIADPRQLSAPVSSLALAAGETAATLVATNGLDWSLIEDFIRNGVESMNVTWLDPHIAPAGGSCESYRVWRGYPGIASLIAQQRRPLPAGVDAHDAADDNQVIAANICGPNVAFEADKASLQQRAAVFACSMGNLGELAFASPGEGFRHVVLTFGENIDRNGSVARIGIETGRVQPEAEKYERRVERQRAERADRDADGTAIRAEGGDNRHSRCETTKGVPETMCIDHSSSFCP